MRISDVLGKPIVSADTAEKVGRVEDVLLDSSARQIVALLVGDAVMSRQHVLPFSEVRTIGRHAVIVRTAAAIDVQQWLHDGHRTQGSRAITGKAVQSADGARLGVVNDLFADEDSGRVYALEVAIAPPGALRVRHALLHAGQEMELHGEVVLVPAAVAATRARAADQP